ncbi:hypothetical protein FD755_014386 [Muntiacus reevesi]|uniref:G-protein coupled receptors family 3 profile domain-containing protein n=1 Tax=Muntiacus reevesi TaxID=9886 RepID=A0A5N3XJ82_MUNRE|nr:hypothetical protein FD755_014386 [Muntiacus reevesi]
MSNKLCILCLVGFSLRGCKELDTTEHTCYINGHFRDSICFSHHVHTLTRKAKSQTKMETSLSRTFPGNYVQARIQLYHHICTPKSEYFSACILQYLPSPIKDKSTVKLSYAVCYAIFHLKRNSLNWKRKMSLSSMDQNIVKEGEIKGQVCGDYYNTSLGHMLLPQLRLLAGSESTRGIILCTLSSIYFCTLGNGLCGTAWYVGIRKYQTSLYLGIDHLFSKQQKFYKLFFFSLCCSSPCFSMKTLKFITHNGMRIEIDDNGDVAFVKAGEYIVTDSKFELVMIKIATIFWNTESSGVSYSDILFCLHIERTGFLALLMCCIYLPHPVCTDVCQPGTWKGIHCGESICCFDCIPCADRHMSREPDRDDHFSLTLKCNPSSVLCSLGQRECDQCGEGYWSNAQKSECVLKEVEFLAYSEAPGFTLVILSIFGALVVLAVTTVYVMHRHTPLVMPNDRELRFLIQVSLVITLLSSMLFIGKPYSWSCMARQITLALGFSLCLSCILGKTISLFSAYRISKSKTRLISICPLYRKNVVLTSVLALNPPRVYKNMESQNIKIILECNEGYVEFLCCIFGMDLPQDNYYEGKCITFGMLVFLIIWISFVPAYLSTKGKFKVAMEIFAILASSYGLLGCTFAPKCFIILLRPKRNRDEIVGGRVPAVHKSIPLTSASVRSGQQCHGVICSG